VKGRYVTCPTGPAQIGRVRRAFRTLTGANETERAVTRQPDISNPQTAQPASFESASSMGEAVAYDRNVGLRRVRIGLHPQPSAGRA